jgi:hypothetical protein
MSQISNTQYPISKITLSQIQSQSPDIPLYGGGQWAIYSAACCWWTTFPSDIARHPDTDDAPLGPLPCCPHCRSLLLQAPLAKFIAAARSHPDHYGPHGLAAFTEAHSRNAAYCLSQWDGYNALLDLAQATNDVLEYVLFDESAKPAQPIQSPDPRAYILAAIHTLDRDGLGVHYQTIAQKTKLPLRDVARLLAQLELAGAIRSWRCERYALAGPHPSIPPLRVQETSDDDQ